MKAQNTKRILVGLLLSLTVAVAATVCSGGSEPTGARSMIIVFTSEDALVVRDGQELPARVGMVVHENDIIRTTNGKVDLQTRNGSAVRIKEYTTVTISSLYGEGSADTRLAMDHGSLMATVDRQSDEENFSVVTPTAIAGVRGTTFTVEAEQGQPARVRVIDGQVAMRPRIVALEEASAEEIQADENLRRLAEIADSQEQTIEESSEGTLNPDVEERVAALNTRTVVAEAEERQTATAEGRQEIEAALQGDRQAVQVSRTEITREEMADAETLVTVDAEVVDRIQSGDDTAVVTLQEQRESRQNEVLTRIENEAREQNLGSEQAIMERYNKLEELTLRDGTVLTGAVIAQTGNILVIHTAEGVRRVNTADVASQAMRF
ncbi:MAG: FecR domain-containing protein [Spirochaetales bacterium]|nr:FecR domain-containing protein [Leptospiraceae bacterium]MCP5481926.1 FecR domain-containing protein [Spirochaetales bacterium]